MPPTALLALPVTAAHALRDFLELGFADHAIPIGVDPREHAFGIAAARALAKLGEAKLALSVLEAELQSEHQWGRLAAAIVLDEMDAQAKPAIPALKRALKNQPNKYIVRVANRALNELQGTKNVVP